MSEPRKSGVEDRLYANEIRPDKVSHIEITDGERCLECVAKPCTTACPAGTYTLDSAGERIIINFDNCLECGACRSVCPFSVIEWKNPMGGMGICYRYG